MTHFQRKIAYLVAIVLLIFPLWMFSSPATSKTDGGLLAAQRRADKLSEADLGMIDPTSVSMKLATFGMHAFAVDWLWIKAIDYKEREDFTNFDATLNQITHLQPHFVNVWDFQGHNVAFNISFELDDYRDRYHYVIKGFKLMEKGIRYNENKIKLPRSYAGFISLKIGRSDEKRLYRGLFRKDDDYHAPPRDQNWLLGTRYEHRPESLRDAFLLSKWWYREAEKLVTQHVVPNYGSIYPVVFHSEPVMEQIQYAKSLAEYGEFGKNGIQAQQAWETAGKEWQAFSELSLPALDGFHYRLSDYEAFKKQREELRDKVIALQPDLLERLRKEVLDNLTDEEKAAWDKEPPLRSPEEMALVRDVQVRLTFGADDIAEAMTGEKRTEALRLADQYRYAFERSEAIEQGREAANFDYWQRRCEIEQMPQSVAARQAAYEAEVAFKASNLPASLAKYESAIDLWNQVLGRFPIMMDEPTFIEDLYEMIEKYQGVLQQTRPDGSRDLPDDFPLQYVVDRWMENKREGR